MPVSKTVTWIGDGWRSSTNGKRHFTYYKRFKFGSIVAGVGDFIMVANADAAEPDTMEGSDVAKIKELYETDSNPEDPFRAVVQWYSRAADIPTKWSLSKSITVQPVLNFPNEVVEDRRPFDTNISVETVFSICKVITIDWNEDPSLWLDHGSSAGGVFVCRYRLVPVLERVRCCLEPAIDHWPNEPPLLRERSRRKDTSEKSPLRSPRQKLKSNSVMHEDSSSSSSQTSGSVQCLVSDTEEISSNFDHNNTSKQNINGSKRPKSSKKNRLKDGDITELLNDSSGDSLDCENTSSQSHKRVNVTFDSENTPKRKIHNEDHLGKETPKTVTPKKQVRVGSVPEKMNNELPKYGSKSKGKIQFNSEVKCNLIGNKLSSKLDEDHKTPRNKSRAKRKLSIDANDIDVPNSMSGRHASLLESKVSSKTLKSVRTNKNITTIFNTDANEFVEKSCNKSPGNKTETFLLDSSLDDTPSKTLFKKSKGSRTPSMPRREVSTLIPRSPLEIAQARLHVSAIPHGLPCRQEEFQTVCNFLRGKIQDHTGGCIYISGVPGTGKTVTVHKVVSCLQAEADKQDIPAFTFIELNGMRLTEPRQAYVQFLLALTGQKTKPEQAQHMLERRFKSPAPRRTATVLLVDELDLLWTKRQDVVYNLLDWPSHSCSRLIVVAVANTMDLPERLLMNRVTSRMGLTRVTFQPYTFRQLQEIVLSRLEGLSAPFDPDAIQLVARKVASVSGDARRALDMCRRAVELTRDGGVVTMAHVDQVLQEMIASPKIQAIKSCSLLEQKFLQAVAAEISRTGIEETVFNKVYQQLSTLCVFDGLNTPSISEAFGLCARLGWYRLLLTEHSRAAIYQKVLLNVSVDDVHYAITRL
uniref:Origin recognition complex subunit 1 n=1 Tax=Timema genevievae TaxID=629358 RepID=A0A7R9JQN5_TIMGE|nr:unnamed protein product [Timema genevievae]